MLKKIGTSARLRIERMLETKVFLELYVKVQPGWRDARGFVEELDWRRQLEHLTDGRVELPKAPPKAFPYKTRATKAKHNKGRDPVT